MPYQVLVENRVKRRVRKLHRPLRAAINAEVHRIANNPPIGEPKVGDLAGVRVHKFRYLGLEYLIAYTVDHKESTATIVAIGPHENFYRDLRRYLR